jgi:hypothetical protein
VYGTFAKVKKKKEKKDEKLFFVLFLPAGGVGWTGGSFGFLYNILSILVLTATESRTKVSQEERKTKSE